MCIKCEQVVRKHFGTLNDEDVDFVLWEMTAFPVCGCDELQARLVELAGIIQPSKRGWKKRLGREAQRIESAMFAVLKEHEGGA